MARRLLLALVLCAAGAGVVYLAAAKRGLPWEFGGRAAVVLETSGDVELRLSNARVDREARESRVMALEAGADIYPGDRISVGPLGFARVNTTQGTFSFDTHSSGVFRVDLLELSRGRVELDLHRTAQVRQLGERAERVVLTAGSYVVQAESAGFAVLVKEGAAILGQTRASKDEALVVVAGTERVVKADAEPGVAEVKLSRAGENIVGTAPPLTQVFVNGRALAYPLEGRVEARIPVGVKDIVVIARDIFGRTRTVDVPEG